MDDSAFDLRGWFRAQPHKGYEAHLEDDDRFVLETDYARAHMSFYDMAPEPEVVELRIEEKATGEVRFFLHFHPVERGHSIGLVREMELVLVSLAASQRTEILLCCTAGMTTSFFADRLNQAAEALGLDWGFSAVSVTEAYEHGRDRAAILVAPQIAYQAERVRKVMGGVPVLEIPTATFASYDAAGCLEWVRGELEALRAADADEEEDCACPVESKMRVLVISVHAAPQKMTLHYRVYHEGVVELDRTAVKRSLSVADLTDVIDTQLSASREGRRIDAVGIALPGTLRDGHVDLSGSHDVDFTSGTGNLSLGDYLSARYDMPVRLCNNANAAALGWHGAHPEYDDVTFYSQAAGWTVGGQGHMVGGQLVEGAHGSAGEIMYVVSRFAFKNPLFYNAYDPADVLEMVGTVLAMDCATYDPEVVALRCELLPDMEEVAAELARYVPRELQPKLVHVADYDECILAGMLARCLK